MRVIRTSSSSGTRNHVHASWITRLLLAATALLLACSIRPLFGQVDLTQLQDQSTPRVSTVSKNQLLAPDKALRAMERARKYVLAQRMELALKEVNRAIDIAPHYGTAKVLLGGIHLYTQNDDAAAKSFQEALDDDPALGAAYFGMAMILVHQKRFQAALPILDHAEGLMPGVWLVRFAESWTNLELGNTETALKQAEIAERIARNAEERSGTSYLRASVCIYLKDSDHAREYLSETVARDPGGQYAALAKRQLEGLQPLLVASR